MDVKPGDVVVLKSGGQALTVAEVSDERAECVWLGEDGELYRETLPLIVLEHADLGELDEEEPREENDDEDEDEDEEDEESDAA